MKNNMENKNLWILTEEKPKREVIREIVLLFAKDNKIPCFVDAIRIIPQIENSRFQFVYEVIGFRSNKISKVLIKTVSGYNSFVDFLVFYQKEDPVPSDTPLYVVEETKTDDQESRNTGVYQRASKFSFTDFYYPNAKKIMLYNLKVEQKKPTDTYIFGTKLLLTIGVEIIGKKLNPKIFQPFKTIEELISCKESMKKPPKGNVPITIRKEGKKIKVSGRLYKSGNLSHDPNIGAISAICSSLRKLGWEEDIVITHHGLEQKHLSPNNKFIKIANDLNIKIDGLSVPRCKYGDNYWKYEKRGEKLGTIFIHLVVENFTEGFSIFENHAGCEKGYFITHEGDYIPLKKYSDREAYKSGDKTKIVSIPDLMLIDLNRSEIINIEGKKYDLRGQGIEELEAFKDIEEAYLKKYYPDFKIIRTIVLYGGTETEVYEIEVGFLLNEKGDLILGIKAPKLFQEGIKNLLGFWS